MSSESFEQVDIPGAMAFLEGDKDLMNDETARSVVESGGMLDGKPVGDLMGWLEKRKKAHETGVIGDTSTEAYLKNNPDAMAVHSDKNEKK